LPNKGERLARKCPKCKTKNPDTQNFCGNCGAPLVQAKDVTITKTLMKPRPTKTIAGKYKILEELGKGGMGVVYKAKDTRLKRSVALKFLPAELTQDKEAKKRFIQEAQAAAALEHANICIVHEVDEADGQIFITMSYIDGQSLKDRLKQGPLSIDKAKEIALQVAEGLREAHEKGIVHRDVKPANIMLTKKEQAKITDFGLAKLSWGIDLTKTSTIMGTVAYMSPEQVKGEKVDQRTDIWSLGAMLYEMLTGKRPFDKAQEHALIYSILDENPRPVAELRADIPSHLVKVVDKALAKKAEERYQSMIELIQDIKQKPAITSPKKDKSIAVLSFENMSADPEQEYFCAGISEEIINALTQVKDLRVVARTSAFSFKGTDIDIKEIGRRLNVNKVLEGSVRKSGNKLRITAQLINVADGYHLWSQRFDREMEDIFAIQDEISLAIVNKLKLELLGDEKSKLTKRYTENTEAYNLYLKGVYFMRRHSPEGIEEAKRCFQHALKKDPNYGLVFVHLAEISIYGTLWKNVPPRKAYSEAKKYLQRALEIDDTLAEALGFLAYIHAFCDWNWKEAENEFEKALQLDPNNVENRLWYSYFLIFSGGSEEAIIEARKVQELDPLSSVINSGIGLALLHGEQYDTAIEELRAALKIDPDYHQSHLYLGYCLFQESLFEEAIVEFEKAVELSGSAPFQVMVLAVAFYEIGRKVEAEKLFESLKDRSKDEYVPPLCFFYIHRVQGEKEMAFEWMEQACQESDIFLSAFRVFPVDFLRLPDEPEYMDLFKKYGLK
jgi:serine/threonine protein kinase/Flp pilus assembly protein TadD